jgi:hypothetical protein
MERWNTLDNTLVANDNYDGDVRSTLVLSITTPDNTKRGYTPVTTTHAYNYIVKLDTDDFALCRDPRDSCGAGGVLSDSELMATPAGMPIVKGTQRQRHRLRSPGCGDSRIGRRSRDIQLFQRRQHQPLRRRRAHRDAAARARLHRRARAADRSVAELSRCSFGLVHF